MADKGKGKQSKEKKPKMAKMGNRPHEVRQREALRDGARDPEK